MQNEINLYRNTLTGTIGEFKSMMANDLEKIEKLISMMKEDPERIPSITSNLVWAAASLQENSNAMRALQNVRQYVDRETWLQERGQPANPPTTVPYK